MIVCYQCEFVVKFRNKQGIITTHMVPIFTKHKPIVYTQKVIAYWRIKKELL